MPTPTLNAGGSYTELVTAASYPASAGWVLKSRFTPRAAGGAAVALTAAAEGDSHRFTATAAVTATWAAGAYSWVQWAERGSDSYTVATGQLQVLPNLRTLAVGTDTRSQAQRALDDCRAAYAAWTPLTKRYKVGDREREFNSAAEILTTIRYWEQQVAREAAATSPNAAATQGGRFYIRGR